MLKKLSIIFKLLIFFIVIEASAQTYHLDGYVIYEETLDPVGAQMVDVMNSGGIPIATFLSNDQGFYMGEFDVADTSSFVVVETWRICNEEPVFYSQEIVLDRLYLTASFFLCGNVECIADFNVVQTTLNFLEYEFTDISQGEVNDWLWDFDDGTFSDEQNPVHVFLNEGQYQVKLFITGPNCIDQKEKEIFVVTQACLAKFSWEYITFPDDLTIAFSDESQGEIIEWFWYFGDGIISQEQNPVHHYYEPGTYEVELEVLGLECMHTLSQTLIVDPPSSCYAHFGNRQLASEDLKVEFTDLSISDDILFWWWEFGDGNTSELQNPEHIYTSAGVYPVTLFVAGENCASKFIRVIQVFETNNCLSDFEYLQANPDIPEIHFLNLAPADSLYFQWDFGDGNVSSEFSPVHLYSDFGIYTIKLKAQGYGCQDSISNQIEIAEPVFCEAEFLIEQQYPQSKTIGFVNQSIGEGLSCEWNFGDGNTSTVLNPVHEYESAGQFKISLSILTSDSCNDSIDHNLDILPPLTISGNVWATESLLNMGRVYLYRSITEASFEVFDMQLLTDGSFLFSDLIPGEYLIQAIPDFNFPVPVIPNYFPTYAGNSLSWLDAQLINTNNLPGSIEIELKFYNDFFNGTASARGKVIADERADGIPLVMFIVNENAESKDFKIINDSGVFEFDDIPFGQYNLIPEKAGKTPQAFSFGLNELAPGMANILFLESTDMIYPDLTQLKEQSGDLIRISPNPAKDHVNILIPHDISLRRGNLKIHDLNGVTVISTVIRKYKHIQNISSLPPGIYILEIEADMHRYYHKLMIQK